MTVSPRDALVDRPLSIRVSGLAPRSLVTMTATAKPDGQTWRSRGVFRADGAGRVILSRDPSLGGTYRGRYRMGLFWSMHHVGSKLPFDQQTMPLPAATTIRFAASENGRTVASTTLTWRTIASGVTERKTTLGQEGFIGCLYSPSPASKPAPAVMLIGGSEGGLHCGPIASLLASHGYATLSLAYFGLPGLPANLRLIPLEYFEHALEWLGRQPGVDPGKLVVDGISRGGEGTMLIGSTYPNLVHGVVEYVGSNVVLGQPGQHSLVAAWTVNGQAIAPGTAIPVEKIAGPVFLVGALEDLIGPSAAFATRAVERLQAVGRRDYTLLIYRCGHSVGAEVPNAPTATVHSHTRYNPLDLGGSPNAASLARADSWPKLLDYLRRLR